jgi:hypothetical protein
MYQKNKTHIKRLIDGAIIPFSEENRDYVDYIKWVAKGNTPLPEDTPTVSEIQLTLVNAVQNHLDQKAQSLGYDDIKTAVTYADEPAVAKFQQEGKALRAWRSRCWGYCYSALDSVMAGSRSIPTVDELILELPIFLMEV